RLRASVARRNGLQERVQLRDTRGRVLQTRLADVRLEREHPARTERPVDLREEMLEVRHVVEDAARPDAVVRRDGELDEVQVAGDEGDASGKRTEPRTDLAGHGGAQLVHHEPLAGAGAEPRLLVPPVVAAEHSDVAKPAARDQIVEPGALRV